MWSAPVAACSGPFFPGIPTVPLDGSMDVPTNASIRVADMLGGRASLDIELAATGAPGVVVTLTRDAETAFFVGTPDASLLPETMYEVRVNRPFFCAHLFGSISSECGPTQSDDVPVVISTFHVGTAMDNAAPESGMGEATFSFGEVVEPGPSTCAHHDPTRSYVWVTPDETGWVATDDVGIAGYHLLRDGEVIARYQSSPFPRGVVACQGFVEGDPLLPGTYQVIAEDYAGNQSMLSAASTLIDPCPSDTAQGCSTRVGAPYSPRQLGVFALVVLGALLRCRRATPTLAITPRRPD